MAKTERTAESLKEHAAEHERQNTKDMFAELGASDNERVQVTKELFNEKEGIRQKTDLDDREIFGCARLMFMAKQLKVPSLESFVQDFTMFRVSRKRKGRGEFIDAIKAPPMDPMLGRGGLFGGGGFGGMRR